MKFSTGAMLVASILVNGCSGEEAHFEVRYAPEFTQRQISSSIFGLFKDGSMSGDAWGALSPKLSSWLGSRACDVAYDSGLVKKSRVLAYAVDDYVRNNGITDDLLAEFAPRA